MLKHKVSEKTEEDTDKGCWIFEEFTIGGLVRNRQNFQQRRNKPANHRGPKEKDPVVMRCRVQPYHSATGNVVAVAKGWSSIQRQLGRNALAARFLDSWAMYSVYSPPVASSITL